MNLPPLSAGVSRKNTPAPAVSDAVVPLRVSGPFGPIGLPGQDCNGACLHVCMMSGGGIQHCMQTCMSTCGGTPGGFRSLM
jgi:hypothetical protein